MQEVQEHFLNSQILLLAVVCVGKFFEMMFGMSKNLLKDQKINFINNLLCCALFSEPPTALSCTRQIGEVFGEYDERIAVIIRRRLEALSCHKDEKIRIQAYQTLLLKDPHHDYSKMFPTFIQSGQSFLTDKSIKEIAKNEIGKHKLESLRQRLFTYRKQLTWPADPEKRKQTKNNSKRIANDNFGSERRTGRISKIRSKTFIVGNSKYRGND